MKSPRHVKEKRENGLIGFVVEVENEIAFSRLRMWLSVEFADAVTVER